VTGPPGYFRFGREAICYGGASSGFRSKRLEGPLYDAALDAAPDGGSVRLPLDPDEIVSNLRFERYLNTGAANGRGAGAELRTLYY
jgi:hypothetical protein